MSLLRLAWLALATSATVTRGRGAQEALTRPEDIQEKFDLTWAWNQTQAVALQAANKTGEFTSQLTSQASELANDTSSWAGDLKHRGKKAAFSAMLKYLGKCPDFYEALPKVPETFAPVLADHFQAARFETASASDEEIGNHCVEISEKSVDTAIDDHATFQSSQEQVAVKFILTDKAAKVCTDKVIDALKLFEAIRKVYPEQYKEAIEDKLKLHALTEDNLEYELNSVCGSQQVMAYGAKFAKPASQLRGSSVSKGQTLPSFQLLVAVAAAGTVLFAAAVLRRTDRQHRHGASALLIKEQDSQTAELVVAH